MVWAITHGTTGTVGTVGTREAERMADWIGELGDGVQFTLVLHSFPVFQDPFSALDGSNPGFVQFH